jgi:ribosomal protein S18 acetylase RimI-like enzyme
VTHVDFRALRDAVSSGSLEPVVGPLGPDELDLIAWSGSPTHLENVAGQLERVESGDVEYLTVRVNGVPLAKGGIDFAKEAGAGTIWQVATHPEFEGLGLATRLIEELEQRAVRRGVRRLRLAVEIENNRGRRLYEHLGYSRIGDSEASWEAEAEDGSRFQYEAKLTEMLKEV